MHSSAEQASMGRCPSPLVLLLDSQVFLLAPISQKKRLSSSYRWRSITPANIVTPSLSHGRRSLVGCSPWGRWGSDTTEWLHFHFSFSCIGEGKGNPLQCSCLENPRDGGAWWAAVYGVTQSWTRLKRLSSSSSSKPIRSKGHAQFNSL